MLAAEPCKLPKQLFLFPIQLSRYRYHRFNDLVPPSKTPQVGNALASQTERLAGLGSPGDFQLLVSHKRRHFDRGAQGRLDE